MKKTSEQKISKATKESTIENKLKSKKKSVKVAFFRPYTPEEHAGRLCGPQRLVADLIEHLPAHYQPISFLSSKHKPLSLKEHEIFIKNDTFLFFRLIYAVRNYNPHILHAHGSLNTALGLRLLVKMLKLVDKNVKSVLTFTDFKKNFTTNYTILNNLDAIIVQSTFAKEKLIQKGVNPEKIQVILYGIDQPRVPVKVNSTIRNLGSKIMLYYGDARVERGFQVLLDALPLLREDIFVLLCLRNIHPPFQLGDIKQKISARKNTKLLFVKEYPCSTEEIIQSSDLVVLPFIHNTLEPPLTILEVSAQGKPLITTDVGGIKEVISSHTVLLEKITAAELAEKINQHDFAKKDVALVIYSWHKAIHEIEKIYGRLGTN